MREGLQAHVGPRAADKEIEMKKSGVALAAAVIPFALAMGSAQAAFINGVVSFSDGGITTPVPPSTSIVSALTSVTQGTPTANACTGNFTTAATACNLVGAPTASTFAIPAVAGTVYTYGGFTFTLTSTTNVVRNALAVERRPRTGFADASHERHVSPAMASTRRRLAALGRPTVRARRLQRARRCAVRARA